MVTRVGHVVLTGSTERKEQDNRSQDLRPGDDV
jgi:hypothetical protein